MCVGDFGCAGIILPSLTSGVYFTAFLGLVWWWVFGRSVGMLVFSALCVMLTIFSGGHLLVLYLYQLPLSQQLVPPEDAYARLGCAHHSSVTLGIPLLSTVNSNHLRFADTFKLVSVFSGLSGSRGNGPFPSSEMVCLFCILKMSFFSFNTFRLFGMTGVVRTNSSEPYALALHPFVSWPDFVNPLVLLLLYFTLVTLLHKWIHITEEVSAVASVSQGKSKKIISTDSTLIQALKSPQLTLTPVPSISGC